MNAGVRAGHEQGWAVILGASSLTSAAVTVDNASVNASRVFAAARGHFISR